MVNSYRTIHAEVSTEVEIKRSRFLASVAPVEDEQSARAMIAKWRRAHPAAGHHCHAFVLGPESRINRSSDDGEPSGTAGVPILEVLLRNEISDVVVVVTRYFGGIKLGAGGLVRAYSDAAAAAINQADVVVRRQLDVLRIGVPLSMAGRVENALHVAGHPVLDVQYAADASFDVGVLTTGSAEFQSWLAGVIGDDVVSETVGRRWV